MLDDKQFEEKLALARANAQAIASTHPQATSAFFDADKGSGGKVVIIFNDESEYAFPPKLVQGLEDATSDHLANIEIDPSGLGLHWGELDVDLDIPALMNGIYGSKAWMQQLARKGGESTSDAKVAASRANGRKGGRPRKKALTTAHK